MCKIYNVFTRIKEILSILIFPNVGCSFCRAEEIGPDKLCDVCRSKLEFVEAPRCVKCGKHIEEGLCRDCRQVSPMFTEGISPFYYTGLVKNAVKGLKYYNKRWYAYPLAYYMFVIFTKKHWLIDLVIPVPMHSVKEKQRGYNQTELLAHEFSALSGLCVDTKILIKTRNTPIQAGLTRRERLNNVLFAYLLTDQKAIKNKNILLIDDVYTTGATAAECSKMLILGGAKEVYVLCAASGISNK